METELPPTGTEPVDEATLLNNIAAIVLPTTLEWPNHPDDAAPSVNAAFTLTVTGPAVRVERSKGSGQESRCPRTIAELRVPVTLTIDLDSGGLTTTLETNIDGFGPEPSQLTVGIGSSEITFSPAWQSIAESSVDERADASSARWEMASTRSFPHDPSLYILTQVPASPWNTEGSRPSSCEWTDCPSVTE